MKTNLRSRYKQYLIFIFLNIFIFNATTEALEKKHKHDEKVQLKTIAQRLKQKYGFSFHTAKSKNIKHDFLPLEWNFVDLLTIEAIAEQLKTKKHNNVIFYKTSSPLNKLIEKLSDNEYVISNKAFPHSFVPAICKNDSKECENVVYYSNDLFKSYIEIFHNNYDDLKTILKTRYNIIAITPEKEKHLLKKALAPGTSIIDYQRFTNEELIWHISVLEDLPESVRKIPQLKYITRLKTGEILPGNAPAISYLNDGFIVFSDHMFALQHKYYSEWLITHEIAHFYWRFKMKFEERLEWANISEWYPAKAPELMIKKDKKLQTILEDNSTPLEYLRFLDSNTFTEKIKEYNTSLLWSHKRSDNFVSEYAASINPGEDFAESFAAFVINSKLLKSKSMKKYNFIKHLFVSHEYEMVILNEKYRFYIHQKNPDLQPPIVDKKDLEYTYSKTIDGNLEYTITLKAMDDLSGISYALLGFISPNPQNPQEYMLHLYPEKDNILKGKIIVSRFSQKGDYIISRFTITDNAKNETYVAFNKDKIRIKVATNTDGYPSPQAHIEKMKFWTKEQKGEIGRSTILYVTVPVITSVNMKADAVLRLVSKSGQMFEVYGTHDLKNKTMNFEFNFTPYNESGEWYFRMLFLEDEAKSRTAYNMEKYNYKVRIISTYSDTEGPTLKEDSLKINVYEDDPVNHDSFVDVVFTFDVKDNLADFAYAYFTIRKPSGKTEGFYYLTDYYNDKNVRKDPEFQKWKTHKFTIRFPRHTEEGWYELISIILFDKINNKREYDFTIRKIKKGFNIVKSGN